MNAQILPWIKSENMGNNYVNILPTINTDSTDSAISIDMDTNSYISETWNGSDNNDIGFALEDFDLTGIDDLIKFTQSHDDFLDHTYNDLPSSINLCELIDADDLILNKNKQKDVREVAGRKKIDLKAQKYIIEEEDESIDVETVTENPVLEAKDIVSLLEQFEASQVPKTPAIEDASTKPKVKKEIDERTHSTSNSNNKQIIEALPKELIQRIKESGKRKRVELIDPVPNKIKKRKLQDNLNEALKSTEISSGNISIEHIKLDHDYCIPTPLPQVQRSQNFKKDSGYISEEDKIILQNQPVVQNSDGKLMVSLLKTNTTTTTKQQKKKLNIDEYKKRFGITPTSSQSNSPMSSSCSSPLPIIVEDENVRRKKHEEKLRKMALEVLRTPPKNIGTSTDKLLIPKEEPKEPSVPKNKIQTLPTDMIVKTYVSVGINTELTIEPIDCKKNVKIDSNSLINSIIENVPTFLKLGKKFNENIATIEHGEDKTIIYLPKNKVPPKTVDAEVQTSITLIRENKKRYRRREGSISDNSDEDCIIRSGRSSRNSSHSSSSRSISSSSSRSVSSSSTSRSRSNSPVRKTRKRRTSNNYDREYIQEVEERRVVYVGKIAPRTTKEQLYKRFVQFGPIKAISIHFRNKGRKDLDNYGFVTFENKLDAYEAIEHGNDDPNECAYDLSFGGRRLFCQTTYADLDNMRDEERYRLGKYKNSNESFDDLLKEMKEKLEKRKT